MPKRVLDFDALWASDKLGACAEWAQAEYAWLYGLADASGCFELTNLRVIWGRVAAIRRNLTIERLEQIFEEFQARGLLFVWEENGKRYGHWTGSDVPGRLPPPSWRMRLEKLAPPVPKKALAEFVLRFSRGRAASPGGSFLNAALESAQVQSVKPSLERAPAQDLDWKKDWKREGVREAEAQIEARPADEATMEETPSSASCSFDERKKKQGEIATAAAHGQNAGMAPGEVSRAAPWYARLAAATEETVRRAANVGRGPVCGEARVKPEALERMREREARQRVVAAGK